MALGGFDMTFGEKLKKARIESSLSQEQFAAKMNVSRSAIAKWENNNGMPDINNLKVMSQLFGVSIDYLLDDDAMLSINDIKDDSEVANDIINDMNIEPFPEYDGYYCDIELSGWNDGVSKAQIFGQDDTFICYQRFDKNKPVIGMIGKKYIVSVKKTKSVEKDKNEIPDSINRDYFVGKHVAVEVACKEGIIKGFFDFKNDDYMDVVIKEFGNDRITFEFGDDIDTDSITKIELKGDRQ